MKETLVLIFLFLSGAFRNPGDNIRTELIIPEVEGFSVMKCDLHMHTLFSDGLVWPTDRVMEAWREGLDAICISEHIEERYHIWTLNADMNRSFQLAANLAAEKGILLIRGGEKAVRKPKVHMNAVFMNDVNILNTENDLEGLMRARDNGAFVFLNHPGWNRKWGDSAFWDASHDSLYNAGLIMGIEVVNNETYYREAHRVAKDKGITMLANSDMHEPSDIHWDSDLGQHRPMNLVFVGSRTAAGIQEALENGRNVLWYKDKLIGDEKWLRGLLNASVQVHTRNRGRFYMSVDFVNDSDLPFILHNIRMENVPQQVFPLRLNLQPHRKVSLFFRYRKAAGTPRLHCLVRNLVIAEGEGLPWSIELDLP